MARARENQDVERAPSKASAGAKGASKASASRASAGKDNATKDKAAKESAATKEAKAAADAKNAKTTSATRSNRWLVPRAASVEKPAGPRLAMGPMDPVLWSLTVLLIGFGVVMVYSASSIEATLGFNDPYHFLKRQAVFALIALGAMYALSRIDYQRWRRLTYPILGLVTGLLLLSVVGLGHTGGGAARWLRLGPVHIQPSEMAKVALILWLGYSLAKKKQQVRSFSVGFLPHVATAAALMLLCLKQPDFGGAVVLLLLTFALLFVAGARLGYLIGLSLLGALGAAWLVRFRAYRWERMLAWLHMEDHRQDLAYQPFQSLMGFGSGETFGMGLGDGLQILYLPKAHTDFVAAIVGEELGFIGFGVLCLIYVLIIVRGIRTALTAHDEYGSYIAFGISVLIGIQALINLSVAMAILPTKGLTLPFVSYGGSSLLVSASAMGILLNISRPRSALGAEAAVGLSDAGSLVALATGGEARAVAGLPAREGA
jgi:cell division protein FtsW